MVVGVDFHMEQAGGTGWARPVFAHTAQSEMCEPPPFCPAEGNCHPKPPAGLQ